MSEVNIKESPDIYYLGPITSFHHQVAQIWQKTIIHTTKLIPVDSFEKIFEQVRLGNFGIVACLNLISGPIQSNIDTINNSHFLILQKIRIPINFNLASAQHSQIDKIDTILGHNQAFLQTKEYITNHFPLAKLIPTSSNSRAAEIVSQGALQNQAALCSLASAKYFDLQVLTSNIEDDASDWTEFWVLRSV